MGEQVAANRFMERGNLSEFGGAADPQSFQQAFQHLERSIGAIDRGLKVYDNLIARAQRDQPLPVFQKALRGLLQEAGEFERVSRRSGARYSDLGVAQPRGAQASNGGPGAEQVQQGGKPTDLVSILQAQREDLATLRSLTEKTLEAFKGVLPVTERGEFVQVMLSGRSPFSDAYEELVDARSTFAHFYTRGCMTTIQAVMQVYPAGFEFLKQRGRSRGKEGG